MIRKTAVTVKNAALFFLAVARAFNPLAYRGVTQWPLRQAMASTLYLLLIVTILTAAVTLPQIAGVNSQAYAALDKFSKVSIVTELATKEPIESQVAVLGNARIFVNTTADAKKAAGYDVVVTAAEIRSRPVLCFFFKGACKILGVNDIRVPTREFDLASPKNRESSAGILSAILVVMLPGLLILYYLSLALKYAAIGIAATLLCYLLVKLTKKDTGFLDAAKIATYALAVPIVLDLGMFLLRQTPAAVPAALLQIIPVAAYITLIVLAVMWNELRNSLRPV